MFFHGKRNDEKPETFVSGLWCPIHDVQLPKFCTPWCQIFLHGVHHAFVMQLTSTGAELYYSAGSERSEFLEQPVISACPVRGPQLPWDGATFTAHISKTRADIDMPTTATFIRGPYLSNKVKKNFGFFGPKTQFFFDFLGPNFSKTGAGIE